MVNHALDRYNSSLKQDYDESFTLNIIETVRIERQEGQVLRLDNTKSSPDDR
jgi:hypothetical protein